MKAESKWERGKLASRIIWRTLLVATGFSGIALCLIASGSVLEQMSYYTLQSNLLCTQFFAVILILELCEWPADGRGYRIIKCALTMCILVTFIIYHFVLAPSLARQGLGLNTSYNLLLHYLMPLGVFADWLFFDKKGEIRPVEPLFWAAIPLLYLLYVVIYTSLGGRYQNSIGTAPYFFLDTASLGIGGVLLWLLAITAGFFALSYLFIGLDRLLAAATSRVAEMRKKTD